MKSKPVVYESHMHTVLCGHAVGRIEDYAATAERRGLAGLVVTCHNPMPDEGFGGAAVRMRSEQLPEYVNMVQRAAETYAGRVDVRLGLECDYFPGYESHLAQQLGLYPFEHVLGSVHPHFSMWRNAFFADDPESTWRHYFQQLAEAAETQLFDTLSHPDLIKNWFADRWDPQPVMDCVAECLDRIAATGVAMELNTSGLYKTFPEMNPGHWMLEQMFARSIPVVVGADAHEPGRVGDRFLAAYRLLKQVGYSHVSQFLSRRRCDLPIDEAIGSLEN
ncbi:MAG: histidinol-phosphatase [Phycisphaeraceae bacterium]|nr:histidinol-phosphatase [Phycisphaeraceae bacterium]